MAPPRNFACPTTERQEGLLITGIGAYGQLFHAPGGSSNGR